MRILVTGGVRSGKSAHAESLLAAVGDNVTYLATGPSPGEDDPAWAARVEAHQARRPETWHTVESADLAGALGDIEGPVLVDSLGTWLASRLDALDAWDQSSADLRRRLEQEYAAAIAALPEHAVLVTDEVGLGGVAAHPTARLFADLLGEANQRFADACDEVHLVVAGRVLKLIERT